MQDSRINERITVIRECGTLDVFDVARINERKRRRYAFADLEGLGEALVLVSSLRISFSSFSMPEPLARVCPIVPCLSKRYVNKFFLSSANPSKRANRWVSSRSTSWAAMMEAAAASRMTREVLSFRA